MLTLWLATAAHAILPCSIDVQPESNGGDLDDTLNGLTYDAVVCLLGDEYTLSQTVFFQANITIIPAQKVVRPRIVGAGSLLFQVPSARTVTFINVELEGVDERVLQVVGGTASLVDVVMHSGSASQGGCARVESGGSLALTQGEVYGCESTNGRGGAVQIASGTLDVIGTDFHDNLVDNDRGGGAIYLEDGAGSSIDGATFTGNRADAASRGGGALYIKSAGDLQITNSTFTGNLSYGGEGGGAINVESPDSLLIEGCTFDGNVASGQATGGGAVYAINGSDGPLPAIRDSLLCGNTTTGDGGALWLDSAAPTVERSVLWANQASGRGGGLFVDQGDGDDMLLDHLSLVANIALNLDGQAVYGDRDQLTLTHSYIGWNNLPVEAVHADDEGDIIGSFNAYEFNADDTNDNVEQSDVVDISKGPGLTGPFSCSFDSFAPTARSPLAGGGNKGDHIGAVEPLPPVDSGETAMTADTGVPTTPTADTSTTDTSTVDTSVPTTPPTTTDTAGTPPTGTATTPTATDPDAQKAAAGCACDSRPATPAWPALLLPFLARRRR